MLFVVRFSMKIIAFSICNNIYYLSLLFLTNMLLHIYSRLPLLDRSIDRRFIFTKFLLQCCFFHQLNKNVYLYDFFSFPSSKFQMKRRLIIDRVSLCHPLCRVRNKRNGNEKSTNYGGQPFADWNQRIAILVALPSLYFVDTWLELVVSLNRRYALLLTAPKAFSNTPSFLLPNISK